MLEAMSADFYHGGTAIHTIPAPLTPLLGREDEILHLVALLDQVTTRLVTLTGPGGIGKTRLAIEVASRMASEFAHGACFISLAAVREPALVVTSIAHDLGLKGQSDEQIEELVIRELWQAHLLLVIDNLEHLVETVGPWLATLLTACPRLSVLATSRLALHIAGEQRFAVPPLPLSDVEPDGAVTDNAAMALFAQCAHAVRPDFTITPANAAMVATIVRRLDGVPLAIELAAARVTMLSPAALLARVSDQISILSGGRRDAPARHQTMRAAIAWSYDLLPSEARWLFRQLAVFLGGATLEAIATVIGEEDSTIVLDAVESLVDQSLLMGHEQQDGQVRFRMLEPIREFALERLVSDGEEAAARDAHAAWCLTLAERTFAVLRESVRAQWFDLLEAELDNLRGGLAWLAARDRIEDAIDLAIDLFFFFLTRGYHTETVALFEGFLKHPRVSLPTRSRAKALLGSGILAMGHGDCEQALGQLHESVGIFRKAEDRVYTGLALVNVGNAYSTVSDFDRAEETNREVIAIGRETNDAWLLKAGLHNFGVVLSARGEVGQTIPLFEETLAMDRLAGNVYGVELALQNLANVCLMREDYDRAESLIQEALAVLAELGHQVDLSHAWMLLARVARGRGDYAAAAAHLDTALTIARRINEKVNIASALLALGDITRLQGDIAGAMDHFREGIAIAQQIGSRADVAEGLEGVAGVAVGMGDMHQAARLLGAADALLAAIGTSRPAGTRVREYEKHVRAVRDALDDAAFAAAWAEGQALAPEDVVVEATVVEPSPGAAVTAASALDKDGLSPRELEVLRLMADGLTNQEIADRLFLSHRTATSHASSILGKLGLATRTAVVAYAIRHGLA